MEKEHRRKFWRDYLRREIQDIKSLSLYRACAAEFLGVFMLAFYGVSCNMLSGNKEPVSSVHVALETGFYIAVAITVFGKVSGGHVNPSISIGFFVTGQISAVRFILYVVCQTLGAIAGAGVVHMITPDYIRGGFGVILPGSTVSNEQALVCEIIITFMLLFGTFAMVDEGRDDVHGFAPLMIGLLVSINVLSGWNISGGCMNPARNLGPAIMTGKLEKMWLYWVGDLLGAVVGAILYDRLFSTKVCHTWLTEGCSNGHAREDCKRNDIIKQEDKKEIISVIDKNSLATQETDICSLETQFSNTDISLDSSKL